MKNKKVSKKKMLIVLVISLFTILGGTLAYFTTSGSIKNVLKTALYQNKIVEEFEAPTKSVTISKGSTGNRNYTANWSVDNYSISYNLNGGSASSLISAYTVETNSFTLPTPTRTGYTFTGWTGTGLSSATNSVTIYKGSTGNRSYTANWVKYNTVENNGIYLVSTRNNVTWSGKLDGYYKVGDNNVSSGNWTVTVENYCVYIKGKTYPGSAYTYQFYVYKANNTSELLATGSASVPGNYLGKANATVCW